MYQAQFQVQDLFECSYSFQQLCEEGSKVRQTLGLAWPQGSHNPTLQVASYLPAPLD